MRSRLLAASVAAGALLTFPAVAGAHVSVHPNALPAGGETVVTVNVPNEDASASTTKVEVQLPPGFASASPVPVAGWKATTTTSKLATPIKTDDGEIDSQVDTVTWTAEKGAGLPPESLGQFPLAILVPGKEGDTLTFKAVQTYSNGEVSRWIGAPDAEEPAPQVSVIAADAAVADYPAGAPGTAGHSHDTADGDHAGASGADATDSHDDGDTLAVVALIVGGLGLLAGIAAFVVARRRA